MPYRTPGREMIKDYKFTLSKEEVFSAVISYLIEARGEPIEHMPDVKEPDSSVGVIRPDSQGAMKKTQNKRRGRSPAYFATDYGRRKR